mmetsp:Transcript_25494/g.35779  ORF Transcript_25494/g.35779 Transcript_25494/m.35779 type:complete len:227 (+) Transcript_25494:674-1354(+)
MFSVEKHSFSWESIDLSDHSGQHLVDTNEEKSSLSVLHGLLVIVDLQIDQTDQQRQHNRLSQRSSDLEWLSESLVENSSVHQQSHLAEGWLTVLRAVVILFDWNFVEFEFLLHLVGQVRLFVSLNEGGDSLFGFLSVGFVDVNQFHEVVRRVSESRDWMSNRVEVGDGLVNWTIVDKTTSSQQDESVESVEDLRARLVDGTDDGTSRVSQVTHSLHNVLGSERVET